jgi:hypothetical protein
LNSSCRTELLSVAELRISRAENRRPSRGSLLAYLPDGAEARQTGDDLTNLQSTIYAWMSADRRYGQSR